MNNFSWYAVVALAGAAVVGVGCGEKHDAHSGGHVHVAPHGGTLVELGNHLYNLEFVRNGEAGKLTAYVLDGHAENFLRLTNASFQVQVDVGGKTETLTLQAVANEKTGEKVGDTAQFEVASDLLKGSSPASGTLLSIDVRGNSFSGLKFQLPASAK